MSKNTAPEATNDETVAAETPAETSAPVWTPPNDVARSIFGEVVSQTEEYNALQRKIDAATGDVTPLLEETRKNSTDPEVVNFRAQYDALISQAEDLLSGVNVYIRENILTGAKMSDEEIASAQTLLAKMRGDIKAGTSFLTSRFPGAESAVPTLVGTRTRKTTTGEGGRKPRVSTIYVDGVPATAEVTNPKTQETRVVSTFTLAAKMMGGVSVPDIHAAYFAAAGTNDVDAAPDSVEFVMSHKDKNYTVKVDK